MDTYGHKKERCPQCAQNGRDTRGDNLHRYPDGHAHCFACTYHEWYDGISKGNMPNQMELSHLAAKEEREIVLPKDATNAIDYSALAWLSRYEITSSEVKKYQMLWSPSKRMLIFPFYSDGELGHPVGKLMGWQGRSFNPDSQMKYYKIGGFTDFFNILNGYEGKGDDIIIVEDFLSAIKIARRYSSMALLGANLSTHRMKLLTEEYANSLTFWLDNDKADKAMFLAKTASMVGAKVKWILTKHDPKEYNDNEINEAIETHRETPNPAV